MKIEVHGHEVVIRATILDRQLRNVGATFAEVANKLLDSMCDDDGLKLHSATVEIDGEVVVTETPAEQFDFSEPQAEEEAED